MTKCLKIVALIGAALVALGALLSIGSCAAGGLGALRQYRGGIELTDWDFHEADDWDFPGANLLSSSVSSELGEFHSIQVEGAVLNLELRPSEEGSYGIRLDVSVGLPTPEYGVENGVLSIRSVWPNQLNRGLDGRRYDVLVTYPADAALEAVSVNLAVCDLSVDGLRSKTTDLSVDVGDLSISNSALGDFSLEASVGDADIDRSTATSADLNMDLGDFEAKRFDTDGLVLEMRLGDAELSGALRGNTRIDLDLGSVEVTPTLPSSEYYVQCRGMLKHWTRGEQDAPNRIDVDTRVGDATVSFDD